jgi:mono/diheme cytochrome c family protein
MRCAFVCLSLLATPALAAGDESAAVGRAIFEENCVVCHTENGSGEGAHGVDIRRLSVSRVKRAVKGFDDMPAFEFTEPEVAAIAAWLKVLDPGG